VRRWSQYSQRAKLQTDAVDVQAFTLPGLTLSYIGRKKLDAYMSSVPYPVASLGFSCDTVTGENRAPMVVRFSSRGPNTVAVTGENRTSSLRA
jgi:hypothetical protein